MSIKTHLTYLWIGLMGNKELEEKGKMLPCKKCDNLFMSHLHYGEWTYVCDSVCDSCGNNFPESKFPGGVK